MVVVSLLGILSAERHWTWKEGRNRREKDREGGGEATERDETGLVGGFVIKGLMRMCHNPRVLGRRC